MFWNKRDWYVVAQRSSRNGSVKRGHAYKARFVGYPDDGRFYIFDEGGVECACRIGDSRDCIGGDWIILRLTCEEAAAMNALESTRIDQLLSHPNSELDADQYTVGGDTVNMPSHYTSGEIECIDAIQAQMTPEQFAGYLRGNCVKYIWRYQHKGGKESLLKAQWYLNKLIEEIE